MVNNKGYTKADFVKSRDMSYLSRAEIRKKEYFETRDTLQKSINLIRDYYKVDRLNVIADFCAGNTFNGYFALSRGYTKYVWFIDQRFSKSSGVLSTYYQRFVPRTMYMEENIFLKDFKMPEYSLVLSIHPCKDLAYRVAEIAIKNRKPVVIVPCCIGGGQRTSWIDAFHGLGQYTRYSMKISQFIEENNYTVWVRTINKKYTPRNNIIIGIPKEDNKCEQKLELEKLDMTTKSEALKKIEDFRRHILVELFNRCTPEQQNVFNLMYVDVDTIPDEKIDWAIQQCEKTIAGNEIKKE